MNSRQQLDRQLDDELRFDYDQRVAEKIHAGMPEAEARRAVRLEFGGIEQIKEECRDVRPMRWLEDLWQDLRYALRAVRRSPGFTATVLLTIALGTGATTAVFSLLNAILLRPLPYNDAARLVYIWTPNVHVKPPAIQEIGPGYAAYAEWRRLDHSFSEIGLFEHRSFHLATNGGGAVLLGGARVSGTFFRTLGVTPERGRTITEDDDQPGHNHVAVISDALWRGPFGGDRHILDRQLVVDGKSYRIAGVAEPGFSFPRKGELPGDEGQADAITQVWIPFGFTQKEKANDEDGIAIGRLRPGVSLKQAQTEMSSIVQRLPPAHSDFASDGWTALVKPLIDTVVGDVRPRLWLLLAAVFVVLLIACGNVATLLMARAAGRLHETGVRSALGAGGGRLARQALTESMLLAGGGGLLGLLFAWGGIRLLQRLNAGEIPRVGETSIDVNVLLFMLGVSLVTGVFFGLMPAVGADRMDAMTLLKSGGARAATHAPSRMRQILIVAEIGLSVVLIAAAGLFIRSYLKLQGTSAGFESTALTARISLPGDYGNLDQRVKLFRDLLRQVRALPGVRAAGCVSNLPLSHSGSAIFDAEVEGSARRKEETTDAHWITPGYLDAMRIPLVEGRSFDDHDAHGGAAVLLVNEAFARHFLAGRNAAGHHVRGISSKPASQSPWVPIVGVVGDIRDQTREEPARPTMYLSMWQFDDDVAGLGDDTFLAVRSSVAGAAMIPAIRQAIRRTDPVMTAADFKTMDALLSGDGAQRRFQTFLMIVFAAIGLSLALIGIYGLISYSVRQRTAEIGIRTALGATRFRLIGMVLLEGARLSAVGIVAGLVAALAMRSIIGQWLYGIGPADPVTFVGTPLLILGASLVACFIPAWRASGADPMGTLRQE